MSNWFRSGKRVDEVPIKELVPEEKLKRDQQPQPESTLRVWYAHLEGKRRYYCRWSDGPALHFPKCCAGEGDRIVGFISQAGGDPSPGLYSSPRL